MCIGGLWWGLLWVFLSVFGEWELLGLLLGEFGGYVEMFGDVCGIGEENWGRSYWRYN